MCDSQKSVYFKFYTASLAGGHTGQVDRVDRSTGSTGLTGRQS